MTPQKQETPMKILSHYLDKIKHLTKNEFTTLILNKSKPSTSNDGWRTYEKKGVEADTILIFKSKKNNDSFAFTFTYHGLSKEHYSVNFSYKKDEKINFIESSINFNLEDFKHIIKQAISDIEASQDRDSKSIINSLNISFLAPELLSKTSAIAIDLSKKIKDKKDSLNIEEIQKRIDMAEILYKENFVKRDKELRNSPTFRKISMLTKELAKLQKTLVNEDIALTEKHQLNQLQQTIHDEYKLLEDANKQINQFIREEKSNVIIFKPKK